MARLLSWPNGLRTNMREPLSGPRTIGASQTQSISGFLQTTASPFGLWRWRFGFPSLMRGQIFRRYRGLVTALHGGANAVAVPFCDWDGLTRSQMGVAATDQEWRDGQPWSNVQPWSNGQNWGSTPPVVAVSAAMSKGGTVVSLDSAFWGDGLDIGDMFGFFPFHLGKYMVTEVLAPGRYRVWPPLRKDISPDDFATLRPVIAMRLEGEEAATAARDAAFGINLSMTLVEVLDYDVRKYFAD